MRAARVRALLFAAMRPPYPCVVLLLALPLAAQRFPKPVQPELAVEQAARTPVSPPFGPSGSG